jgi:hypothetical protein
MWQRKGYTIGLRRRALPFRHEGGSVSQSFHADVIG